MTDDVAFYIGVNVNVDPNVSAFALPILLILSKMHALRLRVFVRRILLGRPFRA